MDVPNHKKLYKQTRTEILKLKQALYLANKEIEKRDRVIAEMRARLKKLNARLKAYDGVNTPSSKKLSTIAKKRGGTLLQLARRERNSSV